MRRPPRQHTSWARDAPQLRQARRGGGGGGGVGTPLPQKYPLSPTSPPNYPRERLERNELSHQRPMSSVAPTQGSIDPSDRYHHSRPQGSHTGNSVPLTKNRLIYMQRAVFPATLCVTSFIRNKFLVNYYLPTRTKAQATRHTQTTLTRHTKHLSQRTGPQPPLQPASSRYRYSAPRPSLCPKAQALVFSYNL